MFEYRGFLLDSVRHMQTAEEIEKLTEVLAGLGFNRFHWHLADDQGWRFASDTFPQLGSAAVRPFSDFGKRYVSGPYGGVYTKQEMRRIVSFCAERGVEVVPEFDVPGHTSAFLSVFPSLSCTGAAVEIKTRQGIFKDVLCIAKEETFQTVAKVLDEFMEVFPGEYIHIGGDEVPPDHWKNCPACRARMKDLGVKSFAAYQNVFMNGLIEHVESRNRHCIVWNDAVKGGNLDKRAVIQYWKERDRASVRFINSGGRAILSPFSYCYLDYNFDITPLNRVYSLRPSLRGLTEEGRKRIIGVEGTLWTEFIEDNEKLERMAFPRAIAVAAAARGENGRPYEDFLREVRALRDSLPGVAFTDESEWTRPRFKYVSGWARFVKENLK